MLWYRDRAVRRFIALAYLPWLAGLMLAWEMAQVPLYTLWTESSAGYIVFSVLHCTLGDLLIGSAALVLALIAGREPILEHWRWGRIAALAAFAGTGYTAFSEWMNTKILGNWAYAKAMPTLEAAGIEIGWSPLLQWMLLPPLALYLAGKSPRRLAPREPRWSGPGGA